MNDWLAKSQYLEVFDQSIDVEAKLAQRLESLVGRMFTAVFGLRSLIIRKEIEAKKFVLDIGKIAAKLMKYFKKGTVAREDFLLSLVLYYLSERKHDSYKIKVAKLFEN